MSIARAIDVPTGRSPSSASAEPSSPTVRGVLLAALAALVLALLGGAYAVFGTSAGDGFPDPTQQWTD
jgi:hypothetical protein